MRETILADIARASKSGGSRRIAAEKLTDKSSLEYIAKNDVEGFVRSTAARRLADLCDHEWNGCKCTRCGRIRDHQHDWNGCTCNNCGKVRDEQHDYKGCVCSRCEKKHDLDGCLSVLG